MVVLCTGNLMLLGFMSLQQKKIGLVSYDRRNNRRVICSAWPNRQVRLAGPGSTQPGTTLGQFSKLTIATR